MIERNEDAYQVEAKTYHKRFTILLWILNYITYIVEVLIQFKKYTLKYIIIIVIMAACHQSFVLNNFSY